MQQNRNTAPYEFTSSLMERINSADQNQEFLLAQEDHAFRDNIRKDTLMEIESLLRKALDQTLAELRDMPECDNHVSINSLPADYATSFGNLVVRLESLLYVYSDSLHLDPYKIWEYINESRNTSCEKVEIQEGNNMIVFRIPYLPKRNHGKDAVVNHMLASKIFSYHDFPHWPKWTATFFHVYPQKTTSIPRDVDNYDYKKTIDLLAFAFGSADNAINFDIGGKHTIFTDDYAPGVYIEIVPKNSKKARFPRWSNERPEG